MSIHCFIPKFLGCASGRFHGRCRGRLSEVVAGGMPAVVQSSVAGVAPYDIACTTSVIDLLRDASNFMTLPIEVLEVMVANTRHCRCLIEGGSEETHHSGHSDDSLFTRRSSVPPAKKCSTVLDNKVKEERCFLGMVWRKEATCFRKSTIFQARGSVQDNKQIE